MPDLESVLESEASGKSVIFIFTPANMENSEIVRGHPILTCILDSSDSCSDQRSDAVTTLNNYQITTCTHVQYWASYQLSCLHIQNMSHRCVSHVQ